MCSLRGSLGRLLVVRTSHEAEAHHAGSTELLLILLRRFLIVDGPLRHKGFAPLRLLLDGFRQWLLWRFGLLGTGDGGLDGVLNGRVLHGRVVP